MRIADWVTIGLLIPCLFFAVLTFIEDIKTRKILKETKKIYEDIAKDKNKE